MDEMKVGEIDLHIDTTAPFESVKEAVSRFGSIVNRKAEKGVYIEQQFEKTSVEIALIKKKSEAEEEAQLEILKELDSTKRLIEELKLELERAQTEEHDVKQDSQLASAVTELPAVKNELQNLRKAYDLLVYEKDIAVIRAQESASASKEVEKQVENLTVQLIMTKESLEATHAARLEAEEQRIGAAVAQEQELEQAQAEIDQVNRQIISTEYQKSKLDTATALLQSLKTEVAAYKESELTRRKNVEDVKQSITKAREEIDYLKTCIGSLEIELGRENAAIAVIRQREGMAERVVACLEAELNRTRSEIALVRLKEKEAREQMVGLPEQIKNAAQETDQAKSQAQEAREEVKKAKETVEQAKAGASIMASRLLAAQKEMEEAKASENLALAAIDALHEPKNDSENEPETGVMVSLEEYWELSRKAREAEEAADTRVAEAVSLIDVAKESESKSLSKLDQVTLELAARKQAFDAALQKAEKAKQGKLGAEQDLRKWRAEREQRRKSGLGAGQREGFEEVKSFNVKAISPLNQNSRPVVKVLPESNSSTIESSPEVRSLQKNRQVFPQIFMSLRKKKT